MNVEVSPRVASTLLARLSKRQQTPISLAARRHERVFTRAFLTAVREAKAAIDMQMLEEALRMPGTGAPLYVLQSVLDMLFEETQLTQPHEPYYKEAEARKKPLSTLYLDTMKSGANAQTYVKMKFDATTPDAIEFAEREAAKLVTAVTEQARAAIKVVVVEGFENGVAPADTAKLIRANLGLTERDASAVMKRQIQLMQKGTSAREAAKQAERYAEKLTRSRALTIARTETMKAANEGQQQLFEQAVDKGLLSARAKKVWITADPCPICAPLDGEEVGISESFSIDGPPAHPNCRCSVGLV